MLPPYTIASSHRLDSSTTKFRLRPIVLNRDEESDRGLVFGRTRSSTKIGGIARLNSWVDSVLLPLSGLYLPTCVQEIPFNRIGLDDLGLLVAGPKAQSANTDQRRMMLILLLYEEFPSS